MSRCKRVYLVICAVLFIFAMSPQTGRAAVFKVLVVMSYEDAFPWCGNIREGIESVLGKDCEIRYFYMNTKEYLEGGPEKAREAYAVYRALRPDGVIAADDNAQSMFVVPYLKNRVETPVVFCGVNAEPETYGYPARNVTGILERPHFTESLAFAQQLVPSIRTFGFIIKKSPTGDAHLRQIQRESDAYPAKLTAFKTPRTAADVAAMAGELRETSDTLFVAALAGVLDAAGKPLYEKQAVKIALKAFNGKPTIGDEAYTVQYGALCAVVRTGEEQGKTAGEMLLSAMRGTPVSDLPITRNHKGKRMINVAVMKALGIRPRPEIMRGAALVTTEE
jgi:ABC-type uncharacterized transport system substrate-binding protein